MWRLTSWQWVIRTHHGVQDTHSISISRSQFLMARLPFFRQAAPLKPASWRRILLCAAWWIQRSELDMCSHSLQRESPKVCPQTQMYHTKRVPHTLTKSRSVLKATLQASCWSIRRSVSSAYSGPKMVALSPRRYSRLARMASCMQHRGVSNLEPGLIWSQDRRKVL